MRGSLPCIIDIAAIHGIDGIFLNRHFVEHLDYSKLPDKEQVELFLKGRRSIRTYKDEPVSKETIEKLLDIARYAPSGINRQPVNWVVIIGKEKVHELGCLISKWMDGLVKAKSPIAESLHFDRLVEPWNKGEDRICRSAPCIVTAYGLKDDPLVPQSCTIAGEYLELAAFGLGLGACWAGYVSMAIIMSEEVRKFAGISSRAVAGASMMIGYAKYRYSLIPSRNPAHIIWKNGAILLETFSSDHGSARCCLACRGAFYDSMGDVR